jgi:colicin import membrane protein
MKVSTVEKNSVIEVIDQHGELIKIDKEEIKSYFTEEGKIDPILDAIAFVARSYVPNISTAQGRKELTEWADKTLEHNKILKVHRKEIADEIKKLPAIVDATGRKCIKFLTELHTEIMLPVTEWQYEEDLKESERLAEKERLEMIERVKVDHVQALIDNDQFDIEKEQNRIAEELLQAERDQRIADDAIEQERLRVAEIAKRLQAQLDADKKKEDDRKANIEHRKTVNNAALNSLVEHCGITEEQAKKVVITIASGSISNVHIEY